jgi:endonuclease/exonuclease/phosphatase family metal-dependent hydrolase
MRGEPDDLGPTFRRILFDPSRYWPLGLVVLVVLSAVWWFSQPAHGPVGDRQVAGPDGPADYLFCFWNLENLFDDREDGRDGPDRQYDVWYARDVAARRLKYDHLSEALVRMNDGRGPDIIACAEVESVRAAEFLRDALNDHLPDKTLHYRTILMKEVSGGRHIAPAIITRLPANSEKTRLVDPQIRILEGHVEVNGFDLTVFATHWTSHISDDVGHKRDRYADTIYRAYRERAIRNVNADVLVCGDFNDSPGSAAVVDHLHTTGDRTAVLREPGRLLLNLMADKDPNGFGTISFHGRMMIYDQIVVSRGMLDGIGWSCDTDSEATVNTLSRPGSRNRVPWRFGNERDNGFERGYSDHFPITVRLHVQGR